MHELGITRNIVSIVEEAAKGRRVRRVTLDVGQFSGVIPDAILFCFDIVAKGTLLDGARLDIRKIAGRASCRTCSATFETATLYQACACGSLAIDRLAGEELKIREMEIEEAA
ncbi:hydrogenase maturation nickel metallochaperone HypA [Mesorhizobium opportunistum]|uniref:Hydrogenase maturation factor HypA n=1 Tax=Mesorhizobium opportunistum (strain LMG 24607 / HAMBI 3007 / WSM2075) TaxID=536019 RepID=F7YAV2_MESOW|nr:hydrogenase maturation nickel metallochaperone HypA [Mesorhizobium opportunistum]AEH89928.1 hydrogenase expression/synthesis HypA [Mesorhizobium opportunistum WSM2075]